MAVAADRSARPGLTTAEVAERVADGRVNRQPQRTSRSYAGIVRSNILTRFNLIISSLTIIVLAVGELADALFAGVMVVNAVVGIVQETRAKRTLDRLRLLVIPTVTVVRDGTESAVTPDSIVLDDVVVLRPGDQVPVDGVILETDAVELDESALTGESVPVVKTDGNEVLSGSAIVSGAAVVLATRVGEDAWIHRLIVEAKQYAPATSELRSGVDQILRYVGWALVPLGALLFWSQLRTDQSTSEGLIAAVAGVVGLVPQGLVLLVSMALAVAVIRLAREHVVVQELHAVEGLARIDVFCVDKTGTLTTGVMEVESFEPIDTDVDVVRSGVATLSASEPNPTNTLRVVGDFIDEAFDTTPQVAEIESHVAFSSARKWSGVTVASGRPAGLDRSWVLGAPEILLDAVDPVQRDAIADRLEPLARNARRVVLVASSDEPIVDANLPSRLTPRALVVLSEQLRPDAATTMEYFRRQGVTVKVISGDNPATVAAVAERIGLSGDEVDMRTVDIDDEPAFTELVERAAVFGRVLPEQKRAIVDALQRAGHQVAMTGDGVNDIPALKRADIGVAIDTATPATKAISQLVLLDGRFDRMPNVVAEGRRVIANMERVSALFVTKTVYATLFALAIGLSGSIFPFLPRQMSLVSELTIGVPAFALSFRAANEPCRPGYLRRVLRFAVPAGLAAGTVTLASYWVARSPLGGATLEQSRSASTIALVLFALWVLFLLVTPADRVDLALLALLVVAFVVVLAVTPIRDFYRLDRPPVAALISTGVIVAGGIVASQVFVRSRRHPADA